MKLSSGHFHGIRLKSDSITEFALVESLFLPNQKNPEHWHEHPSFCVVLQGSFTETYRRNSFMCAPSTLLFYPGGEAHTECFHNLRTRCFVIEVKPSWLERITQGLSFIAHPANFHGGKIPGLAMKVYQEFHAMDKFSRLSIEGIMLEMMAELSRRSQQLRDSRPTARIELVRELIHEHFSEPLTLRAIADLVGLHPIFLAQAFRKAYGNSIGEYIRRLRIEFACRQLSNIAIPIARIAADAGFFDQSHFTRTFKRLMGMTPAEFRKKLR
jgi:AraC family transcriptional regulator